MFYRKYSPDAVMILVHKNKTVAIVTKLILLELGNSRPNYITQY